MFLLMEFYLLKVKRKEKKITPWKLDYVRFLTLPRMQGGHLWLILLWDCASANITCLSSAEGWQAYPMIPLPFQHWSWTFCRKVPWDSLTGSPAYILYTVMLLFQLPCVSGGKILERQLLCLHHLWELGVGPWSCHMEGIEWKTLLMLGELSEQPWEGGHTEATLS